MSDDLPAAPSTELLGQLRELGTATITHQLHQRGIRSTFFSGLAPLKKGQRMAGRARTLRYVALREDAAARFRGAGNAQRHAVAGLESGDVLVIEARGVPDAGTIGDIYSLSAIQRGAVGVVTDGALRDSPAIAEQDIAVYHRSVHGAVYGRHHMAYSVDDAITCAGVFVEPGDVVVGDDEGAVVIPAALVAEVAADAAEQEAAEEFALERIAAGESFEGLFPLSDARRPDFERWRRGEGT